MYQSIPSLPTPSNPQDKFQKLSNPCPQGEDFRQIPGSGASLGPSILINFTLFSLFKTSVVNLPNGYLQIRRENIDLLCEIVNH